MVLLKNVRKLTESFRSFYSGRILSQRFPEEYYGNPNIDTSLFFTNMPNKRREKKVKMKPGSIPTGPVIIDCKHKKLNHYKGMYYSKFEAIPLACKSWFHKRSKGDYFKILPTSQIHSAFKTKEELPDTFEANGINEKLIEKLKKINVIYPTVIQAKSLQKLMTGMNMFVSGECGSGKTIAYLIAMIENVLKGKKNVPPDTCNAPLVIILLPTRELAVQVGQTATTLCADLGINCYTLVGGHAKDLMLKPHTIPVDILACTVSVFNKHVEAGLLSTKFCKHLVVDDVDSFLAEESMKHIKRFLKNTRLNFTGLNKLENDTPSAQICFFSAITPSTMLEELVKLIELNELEVVSTPYLHKIIQHIPQLFLRVAKPKLPEELLKIAKNNERRKIPTLIFSNKLRTANWIGLFLKENGIECGRINNQASAQERMKNFRDFQSGYVNLLSCTSIASLGLHFSKAQQVLNYEFPVSTADYIHRCGRVGRLGQNDDCLITNFISAKHEIPVLKTIEKAIRTSSDLTNITFRKKKEKRSINP